MPAVLSRSDAALVAAGVGGLAYYLSNLRAERQAVAREAREQSKSKPLGGRRKAKGRDASFAHLIYVLKSVGTREYGNLAALTAALLGRTWMSLWISESMGMTVKTFCAQDWPGLRHELGRFARWTILAAALNAALKHTVSLLSLNVRGRLTKVVHGLYMQNMNYYKANKVGPDQLENADQLIADDVDKFSDSLGEVYSQMLKPIVDFVVYSYALKRSMGWVGPVGIYAWFLVAAGVSTAVLPPYGKLAAKEQMLEGRFRAAHADLIHNGEMVAFMRGETPERRVLDGHFVSVRKHVLHTLGLKLPADFITGYLTRYFASVVGFVLTARPIYLNEAGMGSWTPGEIAKYYVSTRQVMEGLATAVLAMFELQRRLGRLLGLASRVSMLLKGLRRREPILVEQMAQFAETNPPQFIEGDTLKFEHVNIYKPDGVLLLQDLNLEVRPGQAVLITGDNGSGKTSGFRVLCGLWPLVCGRVTRPPAGDIYFLSQVNFVPIGSLREVVVYPMTLADFEASDRTDADIQLALRYAHIEGLKCENVHPTLDDVLDWGTALSPGQKQRMAFARLFFHRPKYAVLDECTNGVSPDIEKDLYKRCKAEGMAVFSISHKVELRKLHDYELHYNADEEGSYEIIEVEDKEDLGTY